MKLPGVYVRRNMPTTTHPRTYAIVPAPTTQQNQRHHPFLPQSAFLYNSDIVPVVYRYWRTLMLAQLPRQSIASPSQ
jgi:hypothetical protein